ncbi:MAG: hypothetical protein RLZZ230_670 [Candidatus Parcubacteria bacterium]|jgi:protein-disulfide isomerase
MQENTSNSTATTKPVKESLLKDLLIPISIVVAGIFIGSGLYFNGGQGSAAPIGAPVAQAPIDSGDTNKIDPVTASDHIRGSLNAPIKIVEFSDFDCPFCTRFHGVMQNITKKYSGDDVAWVYRQFPLEQLHPNSPAVSAASECVAELKGNDAFWSFADNYMAARGAGDITVHSELITKLILKEGIDKTAFTNCLSSGSNNESIQADATDAVETGGRGTPWSILIGPTGKTYPINGSLPQSAIEQMIELAKKEA